MTFKDIPIDKLFVGENIRTEADGELGELMASIERYDLLTPPIVIPEDGRYKIVAGHRRYEAMKARNEATIPCVIHTDLSRAQIPFIQLIENVQRKDLSAHELVQIFDRMKEETPGLSNAAIGRFLGKSGEWVGGCYKAESVYEELISKGVEPEVVNDIPDTILRKMRNVKKPKERKSIAKKVATVPRGESKAKVVEQAKSYHGEKRAKDPEGESFWNRADFSYQKNSDHSFIITTKNRVATWKMERFLSSLIFEEIGNGETLIVRWSRHYGGLKPFPYNDETRRLMYGQIWNEFERILEENGFDRETIRLFVRRKKEEVEEK